MGSDCMLCDPGVIEAASDFVGMRRGGVVHDVIWGGGYGV